MKREIGLPEDFHSQKCFDLYMYAVGFAKEVNNYLDNGYLVFNDTEPFTHKFIFYTSDRPCVGELHDGKNTTVVFIYYGSTFDKNGKVWLQGEVTKKSIKKDFSTFKIVNPKNIEKIKFKEN